MFSEHRDTEMTPEVSVLIFFDMTTYFLEYIEVTSCATFGLLVGFGDGSF